MMEFLERNGANFVEHDSVEEVAERLEGLAAGTLEEDEFVTWFRSCVDPYASMSDDEFKPLEARLVSEEVDCLECRGTGTDLDGSLCIECGGEGRMVIADVGIFVHALVRRGLANLSSGELAATLSLASAFGVDWRESLGVPDDVPAELIWEEAVRVAAKTPLEAEKAIARWRHGV
jgi:hypothetical protein